MDTCQKAIKAYQEHKAAQDKKAAMTQNEYTRKGIKYLSKVFPDIVWNDDSLNFKLGGYEFTMSTGHHFVDGWFGTQRMQNDYCLIPVSKPYLPYSSPIDPKIFDLRDLGGYLTKMQEFEKQTPKKKRTNKK